VVWSRSVPLTMPDDHICPGGHSSRVTALALGGVRAAWILERTGLRAARWLVSATIVACEERIVAAARAGTRGGVALIGDGGLAAFAGLAAPGVSAITHPDGARPAAVAGRPVLPLPGTRASSADGRRVALATRSGWIELRTKFGLLVRRIHAPGARSVALQ